MASRHRLQEAMEKLANKKQNEYEKKREWTNTKKYFYDWERHNNKFGEWTSDEYYQNSTADYIEDQKRKDKEKRLNQRRDKLRKLFDEDNTIYGMEITESPRTRQGRRSNDHQNEIPTEILKDLNIGLKLADEERRKHEAEIKLYHQWRNENPVIRDYEQNQHKAHLKLAWLDQQIEKRMAQEKLEIETQKMIEDRERLRKEEDELEKMELEIQLKKEKELQKKIDQHLKYYKENQVRESNLVDEAESARIKSSQIDDLLKMKEKEIQRRRQNDLVVYNLNQSKMRLRTKAMEVEEELRRENELINQLERLRLTEQIENEEAKKKLKSSMDTYMKYVRELQNIEKQRQQYISFIFDSEAKLLWQKQERLWREEQDTRDKLFKNVITDLKQQIQDKIYRNNRSKKLLEQEKEEALKVVQDNERKLREQREELQKARYQRKCELDQQINEKKLIENERKLREDKQRLEELENIKKEEERLKNELMLMQRGKYHPKRYQRRTAFW